MDIIGLLVVVGFVLLTLWLILSRIRVFYRLRISGITVTAIVTDIKRESRLITPTGSAATTRQMLRYFNILYAKSENTELDRVYQFHFEIDNFHRFHVGEHIEVRVNPKNPNE